jgi:hypothetical protein
MIHPQSWNRPWRKKERKQADSTWFLVVYLFLDMDARHRTLYNECWSIDHCDNLKYHKCNIVSILFSGIAAYMTVNILKLPSLELQDVAKILDWIFLLFPHYSLCASVHGLYTNYAYNKACTVALLFPGICLQPNVCCKRKWFVLHFRIDIKFGHIFIVLNFIWSIANDLHLFLSMIRLLYLQFWAEC